MPAKQKMAGRKKDIVWDMVTPMDGSEQVKCTYCDAPISKRKLRIEAHMKNCKRKRESERESTDATLQVDDESPPSSSSAALAPAADKRSRMDSFVTKTSIVMLRRMNLIYK